MYHHHIVDMVTAVTHALKLNSGQSLAVEQAIQACWRDKIAIVWSIEDIQLVAEDKHHCHFTEEDAVHILESLLENHDAELGITWDTLYWCIDEEVENGIATLPIQEEEAE